MNLKKDGRRIPMYSSIDEPEYTPEEVPERDAEEALIEKFIEHLPGMNDLNKYWARKEASEKIKQGVPLADLYKRYEFYSERGAIRTEIKTLFPNEAGHIVCDLIDKDILDKSSKEGFTHEWKVQELNKVKKDIETYLKDKNFAAFMSRQKWIKSSSSAKALDLLDESLHEHINQFKEKMGAPKFWKLAKNLKPWGKSFSHFTNSFQFSTPADLLKTFSTTDASKLDNFPKEITKSLLLDAQEILDPAIFGKKEASQHYNTILSLSSENVASMIPFLLLLVKLKKTKISLQERIKIQEQLQEEKDALKKKKKEKKTDKKEDLQKQSEEHHEKREEEKEANEAKKENETPQAVEGSAEKQKKILFLTRAREYAEKVLEECREMGIPDEDPKFWGIDGVRNRVKWLKEHGKWEQYKKWNNEDQHIPANARSDGFRFRWLNVDTNLTGGKADAGLRHLQKFRNGESSYKVAALAGAFSMNWKGSSSPVYDPKIFIGRINSEIASLSGASSTGSSQMKIAA